MLLPPYAQGLNAHTCSHQQRKQEEPITPQLMMRLLYEMVAAILSFVTRAKAHTRVPPPQVNTPVTIPRMPPFYRIRMSCRKFPSFPPSLQELSAPLT